MSPAEQLRAAAAKIRDTAKHAAPAPWTCSPVWSPDSKSTSGVYSNAFPTGTVYSEVVASGRIKSGYGGIRNPHNALWITLMSPALAEPLAAWLEHEAAQLTRDGFDRPDGSREELDFHEGNACLPGCNRSPEWTGDSRCDHFDAPLAVARVILGEAP